MITKEDLDYLKELDRLRIRARSLRDKGLEAIIDYDLDDDEHWEQEISENEKVLFRRAKHLAWSLGKIEEYDCEHFEHLYFPPTANRRAPRVNYPQWPLVELPLFKTSDFADPAAFCQKLRDGKDHVSKYLCDGFGDDTKKLLAKYVDNERPGALLDRLVRKLNTSLIRLSLHKAVVADNVELRRETKTLVAEALQSGLLPELASETVVLATEKDSLPKKRSVPQDHAPRGATLLRLNRMLLEDAYSQEIRKAATSLELFNMRDEPAPILFAANYLRTRLGNLRGYLEEGTMACYYRVLRELYNLHNTNWSLGAARPGERSGPPSVFVTTECTRAIGYFARLAENTSEFLKRMHKSKVYAQHVKAAQNVTNTAIPPLHSKWCESELDCCFDSVRTSIEAYRDYVALLLPDLKKVPDLDTTIRLVEDSVKEFVRQSKESFDSVKDWARILREVEDVSHKRSLKSQSVPHKVKLQQMPELDLTETAHRVALGALTGAGKLFENLSQHTSGNDLDRAARAFDKLAKWLRTHLDPAKEYFEKVLHGCLAENARQRSPTTVQELALSALSVGLITKDWGRHDCLEAIELLCDSVDEDGQFPLGLPFAYTPKGEGRVVINAQIIRAFAQLAQHVTAHPNQEVVARIPQVMERMINYFESGLDKRGAAWPSLASLDGERSSLWISAISILTLHRIVLMLDSHINAAVKKHFNTKSAAEIKAEGVPYLQELMCSDLGYIDFVKGAESSRRVIKELEGMRAHLLGPTRASKALRAPELLGNLPVRSLLLYGPPGTGKTTLVKSLAVTSNLDLVSVMSHDLFQPGTERVMEQASYIMDALSLLTSTVLLFDEFEPILKVRPEVPKNITEMLTGNMLPKFDTLYKAAGRQGIAYVLATNFLERLDLAAIRSGRFDRHKFIYYPDAASRACRLVSEFTYVLNRLNNSEHPVRGPVEGVEARLLEVVARTPRWFVNQLCRPGWLVAPKDIEFAPGDERHVAEETIVEGAVPTSNRKLSLAPQTEEKLQPVWKYVIWNENPEHFLRSCESVATPRTASHPSASKQETEEEKSIVKLVKDWDDALHQAVRNEVGFDWQQMLELLSKPIVNTGQRDPSQDAQSQGKTAPPGILDTSPTNLGVDRVRSDSERSLRASVADRRESPDRRKTPPDYPYAGIERRVEAIGK